MNKMLQKLCRNTALRILMCLLFLICPMMAYSATIPLYVGETGGLEAPDAVSDNGYIDNAVVLESDKNLYVDTSNPIDVKVTVVGYFSYTATVKIRYVEKYTYNGHPNKLDHDIEYKITAKYPTIKAVDSEITISVGEKRKLEYTVTPSGLLPPPMNWGPIDYYGYSLEYIDMEDDGYDCYVTGKKAGKAVVAALPYGIQNLGFVYIITVVGSQKSKLTLSASPNGGQVASGTKVTLTAKADGSTVSGCDIYFTTDGSNPSRNNGTKYSSGITISSDCTLKAIAYKDGYEDSDVLTATYTIKENPKPKLTLSASPSGGQVTSGATITLTAKANGSTVSGCDIYFTTNGSNPSRSNGTKYSSGITISSDCTLKAIAYKDGYEDSDVLIEKYTIENAQLVLVSAGEDHSLFLNTDGTLWACGHNDQGQLGDGTTADKTIPTKIMEGVKTVTAGSSNTFIVKKDETLWACGDGYYGQLGVGNRVYFIKTPEKIMGDVANVYASNYGDHSLILKNDGTLWACGHNDKGQLGDGTTSDRTTPVKIMESVSSAALGYDFSLIVRNDGSLWACGDNIGFYGNEQKNSTIPVKVMDDVTHVYASFTHCLIIKKDGSLWTCGNYDIGNYDGDLTLVRTKKPQKVMDEVVSASTGMAHSLFIKYDGSLWAFGYNGDGQLGDGTTIERHTPVLVTNGVVSVSAGDSHSIFVKKDGTVWACGYNKYGQLGDGTTKDRHSPVQVQFGNSTPLSKLTLSASPNSGQLSAGSNIRLTAMADGNTVSGCDIYYTLNGSTPTKNSSKYTSSGITISEDCTLKAIAYKDGYETSDVLTETYSIKAEDFRLSIPASGYATFYSSESAYKLPNGLSASVVKSAGNGKLTYETIVIIEGSNMNIVPRGLPVMLESNNKQAGTFTLTPVESGYTYSSMNLLRGSDEATTTTGDGLHYKLSYGPSGTKWDDVFGWYWGAQSGAPFQIEGHKAWLVVPKGNGTRAAGFSVDGEMLDIESLDSGTGSPIADCYDLQGRRVSQPAKKGIYIINGKKVVK